MASRFIIPNVDVGNGIAPSDGAQLFFTENFTDTPKDTYPTLADALALTNPNSNPVIADSDGQFDDIFIIGVYRVRLKNKNNVQVGFGVADNVSETVGIGDANNDLRYAPTFATVADMVSLIALDGIAVVPVIGMPIAIEDYSTGAGAGKMFGSFVAAGTGVADGGSFIDVGSVQFKQNFRLSGIYVKQFGANDDYDKDTGVVITDSLPAFDAARDVAKRLTGLSRSVHVTGKLYFLSDEWDLTSAAAAGPPFDDRRQGLNIYFENRSTQFLTGTMLAGGGGATACIVNTSGTDGISTYNMGLIRAKNTVSPAIVGSRVGLLQARTVGAGQTENALDQKHHNLFIHMGSDTSFADNFGTIGMVNLAGEESNYHNLQVWANTPVIHTSTKNVLKTDDTLDNTMNDSIDIGQFTSLPLHTAGSNTVFNWSGQGRLIAFDYISPALLINNAATLDIGATFMQKRESVAIEQTGVLPVVVGTNNWAIDCWNCFEFKHFGAIEGCKNYMVQRRAMSGVEVNIVLNFDATVPGLDREAWFLFDDGAAYIGDIYAVKMRNLNNSGMLGGKRGDGSTTSALNFTLTNGKWEYSRDYSANPIDKRALRQMISGNELKYGDREFKIPVQGVIETTIHSKDIGKRSDANVDVLDIVFPSFQANLGAASIAVKFEGIASQVSLAGGGAASVGFPAVIDFRFTANAVRIHNAQDIFVPASVTVANGDKAVTSIGANDLTAVDAFITDVDASNKATIALHPQTGAGANNATVFVTGKVTMYWTGGVEEAPLMTFL
jgi:hypothetical protein